MVLNKSLIGLPHHLARLLKLLLIKQKNYDEGFLGNPAAKLLISFIKILVFQQ